MRCIKNKFLKRANVGHRDLPRTAITPTAKLSTFNLTITSSHRTLSTADGVHQRRCSDDSTIYGRNTEWPQGQGHISYTSPTCSSIGGTTNFMLRFLLWAAYGAGNVDDSGDDLLYVHGSSIHCDGNLETIGHSDAESSGIRSVTQLHGLWWQYKTITVELDFNLIGPSTYYANMDLCYKTLGE